MADKKVILVSAAEALEGSTDAAKKFLKKAAAVENFTAGDIESVEGAVTVTPADLAGAFEGEAAMAVINVNGEGLGETMGSVLEAADRRTVVAVAASNGLYFYGLGIKKKAKVARAAEAKDIVPTLCYIADLDVPEEATGAVLYQALKDPNMKQKEIGKLKEALSRMEAALQRDNREPWDKHDCA